MQPVRPLVVEMAEMAGLTKAGLGFCVARNGMVHENGKVGGSAGKSRVWHWGSCAKALAATVVAVLVEEKKLGFDTALEELGWTRAAEGATVNHLLRHEAGIVEDLSEEQLKQLAAATQQLTPRQGREMFVAELSKCDPLYARAASQVGPYSNAGYVLLSHLVERRVGIAWEELVHEKVCGPLGMTTVGFGMGDIVGHDEFDEPVNGFQDAAFQNCPFALHSSLEDWVAFLDLFRRLLKGERYAMRCIGVSDDTAKRLIVPSPRAALVGHELPPGYAAGWRTRWSDATEQAEGDALLWHMGTNFVTQSVCLVSQRLDLSIVICANSGSMLLRLGLREGIEKMLATVI